MRTLLASLLASVGALHAQSDRVVSSTQPGAYATLAAAVASAAPGDRVLLAEDVFVFAQVVIDKSLRIQSAPGPRRTIHFLAMPLFGVGEPLFRVNALSASSRLEIASLHIDVSSMTASSYVMRTTTPVAGEVRFEDVSILDTTGWRVGVMVDVEVGSMWLRNCAWTQRDQPQDGACPDGVAWGNAGGCLRVRAARLVVEDSTLRAASGAWLYSHADNCFGCGPGAPYSRSSPQGGFALRADTADTILVRVRTSDGNGGGAQPALPPCGSQGIPANAGQSTFTGTTGALRAFDFAHESGIGGSFSAASPPFDSPRGSLTQVGDPTAPLRLLGNAQLGGGLQANVSEPGISLLAMAFAWSPTNTPVGRIAFDPLQQHFTFLVFTTTSPSTQSWNVPNDPFLVGLPVVTQLFPFDPTSGAWRASNPSGVWLQRP